MKKIELCENSTLLEFLKVYNQNVFSLYNGIEYIREYLGQNEKEQLDEIFQTLASNCYNMIKNTSNMDLYIKIKNKQINNSKKSIICVQKELRQIVDISNKILDKKIILFESKIDKLIFIRIDLEWLSAVIFNLVNNSLKAIKEDGHIYITVDREDDKCVISVKDNGTGMTTEMLEKVTNESYSYNMDTNTKSSAGIGLYIVNEVIKSLNGEICIESNIQQGTEVLLKIPTSKNCDSSNVKFENNTMVNDMYYNNMSDLHAFLKG